MKKRPKRSMSIPSREDIMPYGTLDEQVACEHFLGKNLDDAQVLFRENFLKYQEDLEPTDKTNFH